MDNQALQDRLPPQNLEAEQSTLGSMMIDRAALEKGMDILTPSDFYREAHQLLFEILLSLGERGEPVDIVTTQEELRSRGQLDAIGGTEYLMALIDSVPTAANIEYYAKIVEEKAILRRLIGASMQIVSKSHGQVDDVNGLVNEAERMIFQVAQRQMGQFFSPISTLAHEAFVNIETQYREKVDVSGLATGFDRLDKITAGLQPSDLIIVAARPSMGKTAFCLDIGRYVAIHEKKPVAMFSLEMSKEQLTLRLMCSESRVDMHRLRTGYVADKEWPALAQGVGRLYDAPIFIDDATDVTSLQMRGKCRRLQAEHGLGLIIVDYLQLMRWHRKTDNRTQEISEIARSLKSLARELKVPVIALSQLSRGVEQRENKRPMLSDLRESGSIEAEADVVMFLYREAYYKRKQLMMEDDEEEHTPDEQSDEDIAEVIIGKQRNGPTGTVNLYFQQKFACFENLEGYRKDWE